MAFGIAGLYWRFGLLNATSTARQNPRISYTIVATAQAANGVSDLVARLPHLSVLAEELNRRCSLASADEMR